jgi:peptidoglycan/LPS O-acetylase OafA/YrhL
LRGIAILLVLLTHFNNESFLLEGNRLLGAVFTKVALLGLWGVELFFVLSGYLITRSLLEAKDRRGSFRNFYVKRFLRIFPLYYAALVAVFLIAPWYVQFDAAANTLREKQWYLWCYLSNLPGAPRWDGSELFKLGHFWALAVEAHYYLAWPVCVLLLSKRRLKVLCVSLVGLGMLARLQSAMLGEEAMALFRWSTITKIDGLALGSLLAIEITNTRSQASVVAAARWLLLPTGALWFLLGVLVPRRVHSLPLSVFEETLCVLFFAALVVVAQVSSGRFGRLLFRNRALVLFGAYSYGLYVIHGILRPWLRDLVSVEWLGDVFRIHLIANACYIMIATSICLLMAFAVWHLYERPFLRLKKHFRPAA